MIGLDSNVLLRYFTADDARQTSAAASLIDGQLGEGQPGHVCTVALAELVWTLRTTFGAERGEIGAVVSRLLSDARFAVQHHSASWRALDLYLRSNVDFADALLAALNREAGCSHTVTFDRGAARHAGMTLLTEDT